MAVVQRIADFYREHAFPADFHFPVAASIGTAFLVACYREELFIRSRVRNNLFSMAGQRREWLIAVIRNPEIKTPSIQVCEWARKRVSPSSKRIRICESTTRSLARDLRETIDPRNVNRDNLKSNLRYIRTQRDRALISLLGRSLLLRSLRKS
jgi:hypothetical protein